MAKKSFLDRITGKNSLQKPNSGAVEDDNKHSSANTINDAGEVDHLWMKQDLGAERPKSEKNPKIDTGILRNRIADKLAKMNNN